MSDPLRALEVATGKSIADGATDLPNIPSVPATDSPGVANFLSSVKLWLEKAAGTGLSAFVTKRDLARAGVGSIQDGSYIGEVGDMTVPPVPTGLAASGAMTNIIVEWDDPNAAYGNHGYTEVWAAQTDTFSNAVMVSTASGFIFAHAVGEDSTRYYWIRFVSTSGIKGPFNGVSGTMGQTTKNPAYLLDVLTGQLTKSQLFADLSARIDRIDDLDLLDVTGPPDLPNGVIAKLREQQGDMTGLRNAADTIGEKLLEAALKIQNNTDLLYDAGLTIDAGTGEVYLYGLRQAEHRLDTAEIRLDATEANINLRATTTYVDQAIATAVLDPSQIANLDDIYARIGTAEVDIDALQSSVTLKADNTVVSSQGARLTTAETEIDALQGEITNKVANTTFGLLADRVTTAESTLSTIDGASITQSVSDIRYLKNKSEQDAYSILKNILNGDYTLSEQRTQVALARQELSAKIDTGLAAEAAYRLELGTLVANNAAAIATEQTTRSTETAALASSIESLATSTDAGFASAETAISANSTAIANVAQSVTTLQSRLATGGDVSTAIVQSQTTATTAQTTASSAQAAAAAAQTAANTAQATANTAQNSATDAHQLITSVAGQVNTIQARLNSGGDVSAAIIQSQSTATAAQTAANTAQAAADAAQGAANAAQSSSAANAAQITTLQARLNSGGDVANAIVQSQTTANAAVSAAGTAQATADATASQVTTLQTTVAGHTASIQTQATTIGGLSAQYTVKVDNNGFVAGFGLASTPVNGTPYSEFMIVADKFSIANVATNPDAADNSPFFFLTAPTTINGVTVPAGAYMKSAYIVNAAITNAKIANLAVDSAKIADLAVVEAKIGNAAISTAKIQDAAISSAKIGTASILRAHIANAQITGAQIDTATITTANIQDAAITSAKINDASITNAKIGTAAIDTLKVAGNSITVSTSGRYLVSAGSSIYGEPVATLAMNFVQAPQAVSVLVSLRSSWAITPSSVTVIVRRNGTDIASVVGLSGVENVQVTDTVLLNDTPPAGLNYYEVLVGSGLYTSGVVDVLLLGTLR